MQKVVQHAILVKDLTHIAMTGTLVIANTD